MNRDQVKGSVKDAAGELQEDFGKATDDPEQQAKGEARQVEGKLQKGIGNLEEKVDDAFRKP
jgi:uncharacterized protein YjbJ (UPF0337 family)